jgi:hypothetical protein
MERAIKDVHILETFVHDFVRIVDRYAKYIIVSGFVVIAHGRARGTEDVDMILERMDKERFSRLHSDIIKGGFECVQGTDANNLYTYLSDNLSIRYVRKGTFVPDMEVKLAKDSLDDEQLLLRKKLPLTGMDVFFSSIEANIAFKEELLKSDKDIDDARHLRAVYKDKIDEQEILRVKKEIRRLRL